MLWVAERYSKTKMLVFRRGEFHGIIRITKSGIITFSRDLGGRPLTMSICSEADIEPAISVLDNFVRTLSRDYGSIDLQ